MLTGGTSLSNGGRQQDYLGVSLEFSKRLSNRWMMQGYFAFHGWDWAGPDATSIADPNPIEGRGQSGHPVTEVSLAYDKPGVFLHGSCRSTSAACTSSRPTNRGDSTWPRICSGARDTLCRTSTPPAGQTG